LRRLDAKRCYPFSLIIGDVNGLKLVNDIFGHDEGDKLLCKVMAARLSKVIINPTKRPLVMYFWRKMGI